MNIRDDLPSETHLATIRKNNPALEQFISVYPKEAIDRLVKHSSRLADIAKLFDETIVGNVSKGVIWMQCNPSSCPYKNVCALIKHDLAPVSYACPIEKKISMELESSIVKELDIDSQNTLEMELLYDLIDAKLLDMRTSGLLATVGVVQVITIDTGRSVTTSKDISPEFKVKMDLKKLKSNLMDEFVATRRSKRRYGISSGERGIESMIRNAIDDKDK